MPGKVNSHPPRRKPGPPRKPRNAREAALQAEIATTTHHRRHISAKQRAWIAHYVDAGCRNPIASAEAVGFARPLVAEKLVVKLADLIESERLRRSMGEQMEIDEALSLVADLARSTDDQKTKHAALRTVLEVHGVLSGAPRIDRRETMRSIHSLVDAIRARVEGGGKVKVRAGERENGRERIIEAELEEAETGSQSHLPPFLPLPEGD